MKNLEVIAQDLFNKIRGRFPGVTIGDEEGNVTNIPTDARYFDFAFKNDVGKELGQVSVSLDNDNGIVAIVGKDLVLDQIESVQDKWYGFLRELRVFAKKRLLNFDVRDINKSNLNKRDYEFLAATRSGDKPMAESKMYGTNKTSYQRIGNARLAIKHTEAIDPASVHGRTQKIGSIYIESPEGERFRYPYKHLSGARAMARHVSEGGNAYDDFGKYISGLSEEMSKLRKFNQYMGRSTVMAETLAGYTDVVRGRISEVKKTIAHLQKESFYKEAIASFSPTVVEDVPDDVSENWIDQLTIKQFNEELKDVFPYIYKLVGEATKAKELGPEDLVAEADDPCWQDYKQVGMKDKGGKQVPNCVPREEIELESRFEEMMGQFSDLEEGIKGKLAMLALVGLTGYGAMQATSAKNSPLGQALYTAAQQGDQEAAMHLKQLDAYIDGRDTRTLSGLRQKYLTNDEDTTVPNDSTMSPLSSTQEPPKTPIGEFILSYYDRETGKFPKGETAVLTAVQKEYGDQYVKPAVKFIKKVEAVSVQKKAEEIAQSPYPETEMIKHLAGV